MLDRLSISQAMKDAAGFFKGTCSSRMSKVHKFLKTAEGVGLYASIVRSGRRPVGINARTYFESTYMDIKSITDRDTHYSIKGEGTVEPDIGKPFESCITYKFVKDSIPDSEMKYVLDNACRMDVSGSVSMSFPIKSALSRHIHDEAGGIDLKSGIDAIIRDIGDVSRAMLQCKNPDKYALDFVQVYNRQNTLILLDRKEREKPIIHVQP